MTKLLGVILLVPASNDELLCRHIDSHHRSLGSDQLGQQVDVPPGTTTEIEDPAILQQRWADQAAAVIAVAHLWMHLRQQRPQPGGHGVRITAGRRLQVCCTCELLTVIVLNDFPGVHRSGLRW